MSLPARYALLSAPHDGAQGCAARDQGFVSAVVLIFTRPAHLPLWASIVIAVLDGLVIVATVAREAPLHAQFDREGYSPTLIRQLVQGNWIRRLLWTINAILLLALTVQIVSAAS